MDNLIIEPLAFYEQIGKSKQEELAKSRFDDLVKKSKLDEEENRKTAMLYRKQNALAENTLQALKRKKVLRGFLIFFTIVAFICAFVGFLVDNKSKAILIAIGFALGIGLLLIICLVLNKKIKHANEIYQKQKEQANKTLALAQKQMAPLNALFTDNEAKRLIEQTVPDLKFDNHFTINLDKNFIKTYDYTAKVNPNSSVIDTLSGSYSKNPFLFSRYITNYMGTKTYHGSLVISWIERYRDSNGRMQTRRRTQTLYANVIKPCPYYTTNTSLTYGHQCSPELNFSRQATDVEELTDKQVEKRVKKGEKKLKKKAQLAVSKGGQFTEMSSAEFDVLFGATNRDHEVQFRVMFTPLAQRNMLKLLRSESGYGDDFEFVKRGRINHITSEHAQRWNMSEHPSNYYSYDVDISRKNFILFTADYFKCVFFDFAPLLSVPAYHEKPSTTFEPLTKNGAHYTNFEYEVLANVIGERNFAHPDSATQAILKADYMQSSSDTDCVMVTANSYQAFERVDFVPVYGGDGRMHPVPVPWIEYLPISKTSCMAIKKLDIDEKDLYSWASKNGDSEVLKGAPNGYYHGLFAKIINGEPLGQIDSALEKIKN